WAMDDGIGSLWLSSPCALVRIPQSDVDAWIQDANRMVSVTAFDASDGFRVQPIEGYGKRVSRSPDGRLWFATADGIAILDPRRLAFNPVAPPVQIERINVDGTKSDAIAGMRLPALIRDVWIDYTALSLAAPEKVRFRYKLEGQDSDWTEVVNQ